MILPCNCESPYQDKLYGKGMRVQNPEARKQNMPQTYTCTVCSIPRWKQRLRAMIAACKDYPNLFKI